MTAGRKLGRAAIERAGLTLAATWLSLVLGEIAYRAHLVRSEPQRFHPSEPRVDWFQRSPWVWNEAYGFDYRPGPTYGGTLEGGAVVSCWSWLANERGNIGRIEGSYEAASLKILVFGDSWTSQPRHLPDGSVVTWPNLLQDRLTRQLERPVHVVNFARDAIGILQILDMARVLVPVWQPDLVVLAFITDDLTRRRIWRRSGHFDGEHRVLTDLQATHTPSFEDTAQTAILEPEATPEWCLEAKRTGAREDPIAVDIERRRRAARGRGSPLADPLSLSQSFLFDAVVRGNPSYTNIVRLRAAQNPRHRLTSFADEPGAVAAFETLRGLGVPVALVHLAYYAEIVAGREVLPATSNDAGLWRSLEALNGAPVHATLDHVSLPVERPEELSGDFPRDHHPSMRGLEFYAEMVAEVLTRHGYLDGDGPSSSRSVAR